MKRILIPLLILFSLFAKAQTTMSFNAPNPGVSHLDSVRYTYPGKYGGFDYLLNSFTIRSLFPQKATNNTYSGINTFGSMFFLGMPHYSSPTAYYLTLDNSSGQIKERTVSEVLSDIGGAATTRNINTGIGLTGGGDLSADRTLKADTTVLQTVLNFFPKADTRYQKTLTFSTGLTNTSNTITNNLATGVVGGNLNANATAGQEHLLQNNWAGNNTLAISNLNNAGLGVINFLDDSLREKGSFGHGNHDPSLGVFQDADFWETSRYLRGVYPNFASSQDQTLAPPSMKFVTTGFMNGAFAFYKRMEIASNGHLLMGKVDGSAGSTNVIDLNQINGDLSIGGSDDGNKFSVNGTAAIYSIPHYTTSSSSSQYLVNNSGQINYRTAAEIFTDVINIQNANAFYVGPTTGSPAAPTWRAMVAADLNNLTILNSTLAVNQNFNIGTGSGVIGGSFSAGTSTGSGGHVFSVGNNAGTNQITINNPSTGSSTQFLGSLFDIFYLRNNVYYNGSSNVIIDGTKTTAEINIVGGTSASGAGIVFSIGAVNTAPTIKASIDYLGRLFVGGTSSPTAYLDAAASVTGQASLRLRSGVDPTTNNSGDMWNVSGAIKYYDGSAIRTFANLMGTQTLNNKTFAPANIFQTPEGTAGTDSLAVKIGATGKFGAMAANYYAPTASPQFTGAAHFTGIQAAINTFSAGTTSVTTSHYTIQGNATSGNVTANLPAAGTAIGQIYVFKKVDATANTVTITPNGAETIDGAATLVITAQYKGYTIQSTGSAWVIIGSF